MDIIKIKTSDKNTLDGSDIFKTLLGINDNSPFKITNPKDTENLFDKLDISSKDWYLIKSFLNNGFPPYFLEYNNNKEKNDSLYNLLVQTIKNINREEVYHHLIIFILYFTNHNIILLIIIILLNLKMIINICMIGV